MNCNKPFCFDDFKTGNPVEYAPGDKIVYVAGPNVHNDVAVIHCTDGRFDVVSLEALETHATMAPLCIIDNKPVFVGDVLSYHSKEFSIMVTGYNPHVSDYSGLQGKIVSSSSGMAQVGEMSWAPFDCWSWARPPVKKSGWINIYPPQSGENYMASDVFDSKHEALAQAYPDVIDTIQVEWEESFQPVAQ